MFCFLTYESFSENSTAVNLDRACLDAGNKTERNKQREKGTASLPSFSSL